MRAATRLLPLAAAAALLVPLAGCGNAGELRSAGATPTAVGPVRLWPDLPPVTAPPIDYGESDTQRVPGVRVSDGDVRAVDPVAVVRAEVDARPDQYSGSDGIYEETARAIRRCGSAPEACPVLKPYYRDLTGDGRDELIVGITMPDQLVAVRCYLPENGGLTRIMATVEQLVSVELAGRDLILRAVSAGIPGYEYRTAWSWDAQQRTMLPTRDEIVRVKPNPPKPAAPPDPDPERAAEADPEAERETAPGPAATPGPTPHAGDPAAGDPAAGR
ncbi:hypothetical protein [Streptomyces sp. DH12]|uniref:hypothetical protein n=1 Tax=Streptomyces sp. DH12 TaxID=2857010 RepID=UPI001E2F8A13|nr:hypothetical protein [Streptomyces sp. DH12]